MAQSHGADDGPKFDKSAYEAFAKLAKQAPTFGATGATPAGEVSADDEGAIQFNLGTANGQVIVNFGKPVAWLGLSPHQAMTLGQALLVQAQEARLINRAKHDRTVDADAHRSTVPTP